MLADELLFFLMYLKVKAYIKNLKTSENKLWLFIVKENYIPLHEWGVYVGTYGPHHLHIHSWHLVNEFC